MQADALESSTVSAMSLLEELAAFVADTSLVDIPSEAVVQARLCVLDTIGCMASGARLPGVEELITVEREAGGPAESGVLGRVLKLPADAAARVNGYMGDILELNDNTGGHASIAVVTLALALGEKLGSSGSQFLRAVALGIEVVCRVHAGYYAQIKPYTEAGLSPTSIPNAVGAAAAAAVLTGLDYRRTAEALAIGATLASWSPAEAFFGEGGSIKPVLFGGWPAANAMRAARLASHGITGPLRVLESEIGYYSTVARGFEREKVVSNHYWHLAHPRRKRHACCGYMFSALDRLSELRGELGRELEGALIEIAVPPNIIDAVSKAGPPRTPDQARFHLQYCAAIVACGDPVILPEHSVELARHLARPEVRAMLARIEVRGDAAIGHYERSRLTVRTGDGPALVREAGPALGAPSNPLSAEQVVDKFERLASAELRAARPREYADEVLQLEVRDDVAWMLAAFVPS